MLWWQSMLLQTMGQWARWEYTCTGATSATLGMAATGAGACLAIRPPASTLRNSAMKASLAAVTSAVSSRYMLGICLACTSLLTGLRLMWSPASTDLQTVAKASLAAATSGVSSRGSAAATLRQTARVWTRKQCYQSTITLHFYNLRFCTCWLVTE